MTKKVRAAIHIVTASAAPLNAICLAGLRRRSEKTTAPAAMTIAAGAGPNSNAVVMKNVSSIPMLAETDAMLVLK